MTALTVLVVTEYGAHAGPFRLAAAGLAERVGARYVEFDGTGHRCLEEALDVAVSSCPDGHVLRLDDDEAATPELEEWLAAGEYLADDHWAFPRLNLYPDADHHIVSDGLWPDLQTRLSIKAKSGGRSRIHQGSPFGTGTVAPAAIEHHKFLCRPFFERDQLVDRYEQLQPGAGEAFKAFSIPETLPNLAVRSRVSVSV